MSNLLASLRSSANALEVFQRALNVTQNNVTNVSTPGFVRQRQSLEALPFDANGGLLGGVGAGEVESARDAYAEQGVRRQLQSLGFSEQRAAGLQAIEDNFDISGTTGIAGAMSRFFQSVSSWSLAPNDTGSRQAVIANAQAVSQNFQESAGALARISTGADQQLRETAGQINALVSKLRGLNIARRDGNQQDPGLDAQIHANLEELSSLVDFTASMQTDGSVTILQGGQTPLLIGDHQYLISTDSALPANPAPVYPNGPSSARVLDAEGRDVTAQISRGKLAGLLSLRNTDLPSLTGNAYQAGDLNRLAQSFADRVNQILTAGNVSDGPPPVPGAALFTYDVTNATATAQTLAVNPAITSSQLAAIDPGPPYGSNGTVLKLATLAQPQSASDKIDGLSYAGFYGGMAARIGRSLSGARENKDLQSQLVTQARALRSAGSGVSLDEEAVHLIEFQRAYQATAKLVSVLNELTQTAVNLLP